MDESATIPIPCPKCGRKNDKSIRWLKANKQFTCSCGTTISVDSAKMIRDLERSIEDMKRRIQKAFK